jgi:biotin carboxyl carrier protein
VADPRPGTIDDVIDDLDALADAMDRHELAEVEVERHGLRLRLRKGRDGTLPPEVVRSGSLEESAGRVEGLVFVKAPIVGTFYRAPEPTAGPFVEVGDRVRKGQVLCIIEAMKLMNEIDAEQEGTVEQILVESGHAVHYGDTLFAIRKTPRVHSRVAQGSDREPR